MSGASDAPDMTRLLDPTSDEALETGLAAILSPDDAVNTERFGWVHVRSPNIGDGMDARSFFIRAQRHHQQQGMPTRQQILKELRDQGTYTTQDEQRIRELEQMMEALDVTARDARSKGDDAAANDVDTQIATLRTEWELINNPLQIALDQSAESLAESERILFLVVKCCTRRYSRDEQLKDISLRAQMAEKAHDQAEVARLDRQKKYLEGAPPFDAGNQVWPTVEQLRREPQDASSNDIMEAFMRVRMGLPLLPSGLLPEDVEPPVNVGETSGEPLSP
jgi:hypothetical protein